jgi:hypothetical protein
MESFNICAYSVRNEKDLTYLLPILLKLMKNGFRGKTRWIFSVQKKESIISQYSKGPEIEITKNINP